MDDKEVPSTSRKPLEVGEVIKNSIGAFGTYQFQVCILIFLSKFPVAFQQMNIIFLAPPVQYICLDDNQNISNKCPCTHIQYDRSLFTDTIIMTWDLVCERKWMANITQTFVQFGLLIGSFIFGAMSDKFGRKPPMLVALVIQLTCGFMTAILPEFWSFTFFRFLVGCATGGMMVVGFVLLMEFTSPEYREVLSALYQLPLCIGNLILPAFAYIIRDWSSLQIAITLPSFTMLTYYWLPESPRWLIAVGETEKAITTLEQAAKRNKLPFDNIKSDIVQYQNTRSKEQQKKGTLIDLMKTPNLRRNTLCMGIIWLICGFGFYGLSQYIGQLSGDIFVNVALSASATIPAVFLAIYLMKTMGRKIISIIMFSIAAACLLIYAALPPELQNLKILLAIIGSSAIFLVFLVMYLFASELFPTIVRNAGIGIASTLSRIGSMAAPFATTIDPTRPWVSPFMFGVISLIGAFVCLAIPETKGSVLPTTIEDGENFGKKKIKQLDQSQVNT